MTNNMTTLPTKTNPKTNLKGSIMHNKISLSLILTSLLYISMPSYALTKSYVIQNNSTCDIIRDRGNFIGNSLKNLFSSNMTDLEFIGPEVIDKYSSDHVSIKINEFDENDRPTSNKDASYKIYCNNRTIFSPLEPHTGFIHFRYYKDRKDLHVLIGQKRNHSADIRIYGITEE